MDMLFWTAFGSMAMLLLARFFVPMVAPDSLLARWLCAAIKFSDDDTDADRKTR